MTTHDRPMPRRRAPEGDGTWRAAIEHAFRAHLGDMAIVLFTMCFVVIVAAIGLTVLRHA